ncbi:GTPase HflX [Clostridium polyendosporum]|uniref:GTPase HflX n=1 Tax=Clostridium polyendosporum TaxID=69208 RepID=A0A919RZE1_9CLOT|nr:GTPase HflX [Clostridium polyendosporum]GIM29136.1 GTPase HflX [Clostridium polyendosporum]
MEQKQRAVIVGCNINNDKEFLNMMEELSKLADACDIEVVGEITQKLERVYSSHYIGKGKVQEVISLIHEKDSDMVIFNDELSPSQIRNLEKDLKCKVIDRTVLVLDIFAKRARTKEAQLQVEIAKLQYLLPRLTDLGESLGHQAGGAGLINRGSGETKFELDHRKIKGRISVLHDELETLVVQRQNQRKQRKKSGIPVVVLVGYTNAGKSSIMNSMIDLYSSSIDKKVFEKDMLFATLETYVRSIKLPDNKSFLLSDTVGFISKLPHQLVKAFRSTLEEITEADMLVHVVDYSNPNYKQHIKVIKETLKELGADNIPTIYAYNKADLVEDEITKEEKDSIYISAKIKARTDKLVNEICKRAFQQHVCCQLLIPYEKGNILSYFKDNANIKSTEYNINGVLISVECMESDYRRYKQFECLIKI